MNVEYFEHQICDELKGAKDYIKRAIEIKPMNPSWASNLVEMSSAELKHADSLYKMFNEYYDKLSAGYTNAPDYLVETRNRIIDTYMDESVKVKYLHELYAR